MSLQRRRERYIILHMWKILNKKTSNDLNVKFVSRPCLGNQAKIPSFKKNSSAFHWTAYECSFAVMGPKLWNCIPYNINLIGDMDVFKKQLSEFLLSIPDTPPVRGYTCANSNSLLCWRKDKEASASWSGHQRRLYWRSTKPNIGDIGRSLPNRKMTYNYIARVNFNRDSPKINFKIYLLLQILR